MKTTSWLIVCLSRKLRTVYLKLSNHLLKARQTLFDQQLKRWSGKSWWAILTQMSGLLWHHVSPRSQESRHPTLHMMMMQWGYSFSWTKWFLLYYVYSHVFTWFQDVFSLIVGAFQHLDDIENPFFGRRASILDTVAKVRSCVVMLDLECDDLINDMFHHFLRTVS